MNSLESPLVRQELTRLHYQSSLDPQRRLERPPQGESSLIRMKEMYLAVSETEGNLLYALVRSCAGPNVVEFGSSYGISTIYIAAAIKDRGHGRLFSTEVHPDKCQAARTSLENSQLHEYAEIIEGDARLTLREWPASVDFLFLDGWKSQYLTVLETLLPMFSQGALVLADNVDHPSASNFVEFIRHSKSFICHDLGKQELCCFTG